MGYASQIVNHSKKLRGASKFLRQASAVRWFSEDLQSSIVKKDEIWKIQGRGYQSSQKGAIRNLVNFNNRPHFLQCNRGVSMMTTSIGNPFFGSSLTKSNRGFSSGSGLPPHQEIGMPSLSPTMTEGNIARWLKKEGDKLSPGEVLCEVETDKATVEMECMEEGYLAKIIHGDGAKEIKVGEVIAITVEDEEDIAKFKDYEPTSSSSGAGAAAAESSAPSSPKKEAVEEPVRSPEPKTVKQGPASDGERIFASPLARKLAEDNNVPISSVKGTGPDGSIVKADIEDYLASRGKESTTAPKAKDGAGAPLDYSDVPHTQIRKVTASRLLFSKQTIPHYYLSVDACVDRLMDLRNQLNALQEASGGKRLSVNDLVIKAAALTLRKVPQCNSSWTDNYIRQYHNVNINVAVQTDNGLYVPVIRDADKKGLSSISEEVKKLAQKARENTLKPEDYEGGTFTVSNLGGPFGIKQFCAIINPPQSGILAVGSAEKRVIPGSSAEEFKFASFMSVTLSCDHRVIDGAIGAEWLKAFKGYIENPESMLL
ncbi:dihydrolipoyllysine-residue acetyltransferase component 2 of pyruvate dehydrogenase complex, mitochondrial-like isoform X1 [Cucurbita maxima]|uniref:Acetyltransferase component of pyruvate dehydrogenase complex n=1 Tax=Cucurbita maxima TaxID=3661 RepID=A0A6J1KG11_CUCMA|nr:dihydrolipoyllysine-residue acetyltransferase component 2 of pyruvate dehydrogenase complex, mitochondrial-like isoform X1 [Cucurbita maxima]XP_022998169.1 dihydrolipoyllysine-residue acetyltransferase component 2 of pyruvate dehydrogenase complex, mitochondrial-like isoform X1 [Cucurbita maxima]